MLTMYTDTAGYIIEIHGFPCKLTYVPTLALITYLIYEYNK